MGLTRKYVHDEHTLVDHLGNEVIMMHKNTIDDVVMDIKSDMTIVGKIIFQTTCATGAATVAKTANAPKFRFVQGAHISVKFTHGISVDRATLDINATGAKALLLNGAALKAGVVLANDVLLLRYDGSSFEIISGVHPTHVEKNNAKKFYLLGQTNPALSGTPDYTYYNTDVYIDATGKILTAPNFEGDGSRLTALNASQITTGTLDAERLATSGVAAGSYGTNADSRPKFGGTFKIPYPTVDRYGRVTSIKNVTITVPSNLTIVGSTKPTGREPCTIWARVYNSSTSYTETI